MKLRCTKTCFYKGDYVMEDEIRNLTVSKAPPHFEEVKDKKPAAKAKADKKKAEDAILS